MAPRFAKAALSLAALFLSPTTDAAAAAQPAPAPVPWQAPVSTQIEAEAVTFSSGDTRLSGTLYLPRGGAALAAIVVTHSASHPTRHLPLYRHLREMLPPLGIAVLLYDRRGSGQSGGALQGNDLNKLADDAIAAQRMLAQHSRIDADRIGFWGLSQGGWLAILAASRSPRTAFLVAISAPMTPPDIQMIFASSNILRIHGYPEAEVEKAANARRAIDSYMRGESDRASAETALAAARARPWFNLIYLNPQLSDPATAGWARDIRLDPLATLDRLNMPVLIIYGSDDPWVPARLSMERLTAASSRHPRLRTAVIAGADHAMMLGVPPLAQIDPAAFAGQAPAAPEYLGLLSSWLTGQGLTQHR